MAVIADEGGESIQIFIVFYRMIDEVWFESLGMSIPRLFLLIMAR